MEFIRSNELKEMDRAWAHIIKDAQDCSIKLYGPRGSGKTFFAQELVRNHRGYFYLSFAGLTEDEALRKFAKLYLPENDVVSNWEEAAKDFVQLRHHRRTLLIFEDEPEELQQKCKEAFMPYSRQKGLFHICEITHVDASKAKFSVPVSFLTLADFCENLPDYSRANAMRLHALTGGFPAVAKEIGTQKSFEENVRQLLAIDSAFTAYMPELLRRSFRAPESYYPLIKSMALGHHRLSEIAKDARFTNNKCDTYLEALIEAGFVRGAKDSGRYARYYLTNSYYAAWGRYAYGCASEQVARPEDHLNFVLSDLDEAIALPSFHKACLRFIRAEELCNFEDRLSIVQRSVPVELFDGSTVILDYCVEKDGDFQFYVFPHSLELRYTKRELRNVLWAVERVADFCNRDITVFSLERFSDWCVHESAKRFYLHEVTMDRLKF